MDSRSGARIFAGVGYGGPCLPKDVGALEHLARPAGDGSDLLRAVIGVNERQWQLPLCALRHRFGDSLNGLKVAVLGMAFKPGTGDFSEAPAMKLAHSLAVEGAQMTAYDPNLIGGGNAPLPIATRIAPDILTAATGAQAAVVMTEWDEIVDANWAAVGRRMVAPKFVFDGRNALDPQRMRSMGFEYVGVGRGTIPLNLSGC